LFRRALIASMFVDILYLFYGLKIKFKFIDINIYK
jgi:hypothetical protein